MPAELFVVGLSHRTAPLEIRERAAVPLDRIGELLKALRATGEIREALLVSTCNRVEIYGSGDASSALARALEALRSRAGDVLRDNHCYERIGGDAVRHAFRVSASLDSMVIGEPQILGQVKQAFDAAVSAGTIGPVLGRWFERAFAVAKRVRTETSIAAGSVGVSSVACELARKIFGDLQGRRVLLVGAGKMGETAARKITRMGAHLVVINRSPERAEELARACGGHARGYEQLASELVHADVVISSTSSSQFVITNELVRDVMRARKRKPLFLIDIAVPRDVDPRVGEIDNVFLYDVDDLQKVAHENLALRRKEAALAEQIVDTEVLLFEQWRHSLELAPTIVALRERFRTILRGELERTVPRLRGLGKSDHEMLDRMAEAMVNKLLHAPVTRLRKAADPNDGELLAAAMRQLFELEPLTTEPETASEANPAVGIAPAARRTGETT